MKIASAASAFPKHYYSQKFLLEKLQEYWGDQLRNPQMLARLHRNVTVEGRHLVMPPEKYSEITTWGQANDVWIQCAQELGEQALCRALHHAGLEPSELGALFFTSVTGISSPSIDAMLINRMGLPANIRRVPIFGLGCVAGAAGIARAADYVRAYPSQAAALVSVELCSLTIQRDDLSVANLISSGLFADGSAAVIVTGDDLPATGPEIVATRSVFYPDTEEMMGWNVTEKGLPHHALAGSAGADSRAPGARRGRVPRRPRTQAQRHRKLGAAYRRAEGAGGDRGRARSARRATRRFLGLPEKSREPFVRVRSGSAGRCHEEPASRARHAGRAGGDGSGILFRACTSTVVRLAVAEFD